MQKITACFICILAFLAFLMPVIAEDYRNTTQNVALNTTQNAEQNSAPNATQITKVLRIGFEKTKATNNLDVYGSRALHDIEAYSVKPAFNASQRLGMTGNITYNTSIYKPIYNVSEYSRIKPTYQVPSSLSSRPVYNIAGYPLIKVPSSIP
ncbi:Uncharacterised protein [uncultured archaeon]|nr:Uncharacterised protein [uncultured archaeon]